ncbi:hypothetical protein EDB81DRAFT_655755 [Dactylonectria macrodidyma]|uniref:Chromo domain-containing protein n=1 Tax=Dactylonectria macrodidyma TaxID=307937 RepID=A0A9P9DAK1_9HYPO|nr:hypothetical protein EDB81DRAFT_669021 [Dactylonectria macrodidyma]KAH7137554.1 hypothetical protein EDB81DRAFT_655755 [Dactylonectria macrodidyma]
MIISRPRYWFRGAPVQTTWSQNVLVIEVILTFKTSNRTFHGIRAVNDDWGLWDWPRVENLLWVVDDGHRLRQWQESRQPPHVMESDSECIVEEVIGYYKADSGHEYVAIKWQDYECPTWELESDLFEYPLQSKSPNIHEL